MQLGEKARRDFFDKLNGQKISLYRRASFGYTIYDIPKLENTVMIEFEEYKSKLNDLKPKLEELRAAFVPQSLLDELERLHAMAEAPGFWDDPEKSQKIVVKTRQTESKIEHYEKMLSNWDDLMTICDFNGNLKCNIYGPKWVNEITQTQHYSLGVEFCGDKILALYSGGDHRTDAYYPTEFLVFDLNGNYLKTLETGYMITDFCYDKENNRLIINLNDEIQFAYLDLEGII